MSKRTSIEARVVEFFETAPVEAAQMLLGIVSAKVKQRVKAMTPAGATVVKKRKQAKKVASPQTSFDPSTMAVAS